MSSSNRPLGVGLLSLVMVVMGVLQVGSGLLLLSHRNDDEALRSLEVTSGDVTAVAVGAIAMGALAIVVGVSLRGGARWARNVVGLLAILNVAGLVWAAFTAHQVHWYNVAWPAVLYTLIAGYLFRDEDARRYFG